MANRVAALQDLIDEALIDDGHARARNRVRGGEGAAGKHRRIQRLEVRRVNRRDGGLTERLHLR